MTIYTTEWCRVCQCATAFFQQNGVPFREWDVEKTEYGAIKFRQLGGSGVPVVTVGSERNDGLRRQPLRGVVEKHPRQAVNRLPQ